MNNTWILTCESYDQLVERLENVEEGPLADWWFCDRVIAAAREALLQHGGEGLVTTLSHLSLGDRFTISGSDDIFTFISRQHGSVFDAQGAAEGYTLWSHDAECKLICEGVR